MGITGLAGALREETLEGKRGGTRGESGIAESISILDLLLGVFGVFGALGVLGVLGVLGSWTIAGSTAMGDRFMGGGALPRAFGARRDTGAESSGTDSDGQICTTRGGTFCGRVEGTNGREGGSVQASKLPRYLRANAPDEPESIDRSALPGSSCCLSVLRVAITVTGGGGGIGDRAKLTSPTSNEPKRRI
jgi:hypothetical protein